MAFAHLVRTFDSFYFSLHFRFQLVYLLLVIIHYKQVCEICTQKYFLINKISLYVTMKQTNKSSFVSIEVYSEYKVRNRGKKAAMVQYLIIIYIYFKLNIFAMFVKQIFEVVNTFGINNTVG